MEDFIPTRGSSLKTNFVQENFACVTYENPKKKKTLQHDNSSKPEIYDAASTKPISKNSVESLKKQQEKEMKAARYDVIKYGMSGFEKTKLNAAKVNLIVSLGAKPPKNKRMNYKRLKAIRKDIKEKTNVTNISGVKNSMLKSVKKVQKKPRSGILGTYGKINKNNLVKQKSS